MRYVHCSRVCNYERDVLDDLSVKVEEMCPSVAWTVLRQRRKVICRKEFLATLGMTELER